MKHKKKKSIFKKIIICFFIMITLSFATFFIAKNNFWNQTVQTSAVTNSNEEELDASSDDESNDGFNFIKKSNQNFLNSGLLLLYGGIALIAVSALGIFFTLKPKKKRNKIAKRNS